MKKNSLCALLFAAFVLLLLSDTAVFCGTGETAAQFLKIGIGTRQSSMGGAATGVPGGADSIYWNCGGLGFMNYRQASLMNLQHFEGISLTGLSYGQQGKKKKASWAIGVMQLGVSDMERYLPDGTPAGTFSASDSVVVLSFGGKMDKLTDRLCKKFCGETDGEKEDGKGESKKKKKKCSCNASGGLSLKFINSQIDVESASAVAMDLGFMCRMENGMGAGFTVQNIGAGMKFIEEEFGLPAIFKLGGSYDRLAEGLILAADINLPNDNDAYITLGTEYSKELAQDVGIAARIGFNGGSDLGGLSAGVGMAYRKRYALDIGYIPQGELGNSVAVSLSGKF